MSLGICQFQFSYFGHVSLQQVEQFSREFDATRSTGHLCAATVENFEQVRLVLSYLLEEIVDEIIFPFLLCLDIAGVAARTPWNQNLYFVAFAPYNCRKINFLPHRYECI